MLALLALWVLAADAFIPQGTTAGVDVASREVAGSPFAELRFRLLEVGDVETLCQRAFGTGRMDPQEPHLLARRTLREGPHERLTYEQIAPPFVSKRDYVVLSRIFRFTTGACRVEFVSTDELAPPLPAGWVRLKALKGSFLFAPAPNGHVSIEHHIHLDPGGDIPAWATEMTRRDMGIAWLRRLVTRS